MVFFSESRNSSNNLNKIDLNIQAVYTYCTEIYRSTEFVRTPSAAEKNTLNNILVRQLSSLNNCLDLLRRNLSADHFYLCQKENMGLMEHVIEEVRKTLMDIDNIFNFSSTNSSSYKELFSLYLKARIAQLDIHNFVIIYTKKSLSDQLENNR